MGKLFQSTKFIDRKVKKVKKGEGWCGGKGHFDVERAGDGGNFAGDGADAAPTTYM